MPKKRQHRSKLSYHIPNPGPGLFIDDRARESAERAFRLCAMQPEILHLDGVNVDLCTLLPVSQSIFIQIARHYWADWDYDHRVRESEVISSAKALIKTLQRTEKVMGAIPATERKSFNLVLPRQSLDDTDTDGHFGITLQAVRKLSEAAAKIASRRSIKGPATRFDRSCLSLVTLWEQLGARKFVRSFRTAAVRDSLKQPSRAIMGISLNKLPADELEFVTPDVQFVHLMLVSFDPTVKLSEVRTALQKPVKVVRTK